jgi:ketosteroid isomerase-like protein
MCNQSEWIVREAFLAYARGDVARMMEFVDPDLEWTNLDPARHDAAQSRRGREHLESALRQQAANGLQAEVEEVIASGDKVMLVMRTPGLDQHRQLPVGDRTYDVVTIRDGLIVGLHACQDRVAARSLLGIG